MTDNHQDRIALQASDFDATVGQDGELTVNNVEIKGEVPDTHDVTGYHLDNGRGRNGGYILRVVCERRQE